MVKTPCFINPDRFRVNPVTPFTYRDGLTYLEVLEQLRKRDCELVDLINEGLAEASKELNKAIADLWSDLDGPLNHLAKIDEELALKLAEMRHDLTNMVTVLGDDLTRMIVEAISAAQDPSVFNWHEGKHTKLSVNIFDDDNHYADHGLTAGDYSRKGWTAREIDNLGWTVERLAYHGKFCGGRANPRKMSNDRTGRFASIRAQIATAAEEGLTGTDPIDIVCSEIDFTAESAKERKI